VSAGRVALVIGGSGTIGSAVCLRLAAAGMAVAVHYRTARDAAEAITKELDAVGCQTAAARADLCDPAQIKDLFDLVHDRLGPVQVLVNGAGAPRDKNALLMSAPDIDALLALNLTGPAECMRLAALDMVRSGWGRIVNIGSVAQLTCQQGQGGYAAAKAGLTALSRVTARELGRHGVTVNVVVPGLVSRSPSEHALTDRQRAGILQRVPTGKAVGADAVAAAVAFFCSEDAEMVTGQVLAIDGGMSI
jgi:3-oxoacyl-[acyl-carrier protein] reductase